MEAMYDISVLGPHGSRVVPVLAKSPQHAIAIARAAHLDCEPYAVDELDYLGRCPRCGIDKIEGDDVVRVRGKAYCSRCAPNMWDWLFFWM